MKHTAIAKDIPIFTGRIVSDSPLGKWRDIGRRKGNQQLAWRKSAAMRAVRIVDIVFYGIDVPLEIIAKPTKKSLRNEILESDAAHKIRTAQILQTHMFREGLAFAWSRLSNVGTFIDIIVYHRVGELVYRSTDSQIRRQYTNFRSYLLSLGFVADVQLSAVNFTFQIFPLPSSRRRLKGILSRSVFNFQLFPPSAALLLV